MAKIHQGVIAYQTTGSEVGRPWHLALLGEASGKAGHPEEGLSLLAEALTLAHTAGGCNYEAELYRLQGKLTLQQVNVQRSTFKGEDSLGPSVQRQESQAEACFLKAIEIARRQQAKSWELRAVTSLARLWQQQGKQKEAHQLVAEIYGWFTEGFATKDLQEARALLGEFS